MTDRGPWKTLSSETKYKNDWIEIIEDKVIRPDGKEGIYGRLKKAAGVMVLPLDEEGNVYLAEEFKYVIGRTSLEVCAGAVDRDEAILDAAKRELKEELGIEAKEFTSLGSEEPFTAFAEAICHMYIARGLSFGEAELEGTETIVMKKMPFTEAVEKVMDGTIVHAQCALIILKAKLFLEGKAVKV